jgi:hypothetical protein
VLPVWVLLLSVYILLDNLGRQQHNNYPPHV